MSRDQRLDFFRGVSLVFIFIDHISENFFSYFTLEAITFFDAAEVFIFISGFTAAMVYGRRLAAKGALYAIAQIYRRVWQLYVAHIFLFVIFVAEVSYTASTFRNSMYNDEMRVAEFLDEPYVAVIKALTLQFQPTFFDILPLYISLLAIFPFVLLGTQRHPLLVLLPSAVLYVIVQITGVNLPAYPEGHVWYFNPLAWQFLFVTAAVLGSGITQGELFARLLNRLYPIALAIFVVTLVIRVSWTIHGVWEPFPGLFLKVLWPVNKNNLSPLRLIPFLSLVVLVAAHVPRDAGFLAAAAARPLIRCGRQSLEIFCLSILLSALGHFLLSEFGSGIALQFAVNAAGIILMFLTARLIGWYKAMDRMPMVEPAQ
jgi:hypothetical protein